MEASARRRIKLYSWTGSALVALILLALNVIAALVPLRLDLSEGRPYSLSDGTRQLLAKLDDTLVVRVYYSNNLPPIYEANRRFVRDLLNEYARAGRGRVRIETRRPDASAQARQDAVNDGVEPVQLDVRDGDRREVKPCFMGLALSYRDRREAIPLVNDPTGLEYELTRRVKRLLRAGKNRVGFATDGGAHTPGDAMLSLLKEPLEGEYDVETVSLASAPADLATVWLVAPSEKLSPAALDGVRAFLKKGGTLGVLFDTRAIEVESFTSRPVDAGLAPLFTEWGVKVEDAVVHDPQADRIQISAVRGGYRFVNTIDYPYFPWLTDLDREHPAFRDLDGFALPFAGAIEINQERPGLVYRALARTSQASWLDVLPATLSPLQEKRKEPRAPSGPFIVAMTIDGPFGEGAGKPGRVILFSSSRFVDAAYPARPQNYTVFMNTLDWSVQDEALLSIRAKAPARHVVRPLPGLVVMIFKILMTLGLPLVTFAAAFLAWAAGRRRRAAARTLYVGAGA